MVKKILVLCFDVYDRPFPEDHISNTKLEKGDHYYIQTMSQNKQCPEKRSKIQTKYAHAPWVSYNTP